MAVGGLNPKRMTNMRVALAAVMTLCAVVAGWSQSVLAATDTPDPQAVATRVVGGGFAATGHPDDGK